MKEGVKEGVNGRWSRSLLACCDVLELVEAALRMITAEERAPIMRESDSGRPSCMSLGVSLCSITSPRLRIVDVLKEEVHLIQPARELARRRYRRLASSAPERPPNTCNHRVDTPRLRLAVALSEQLAQMTLVPRALIWWEEVNERLWRQCTLYLHGLYLVAPCSTGNIASEDAQQKYLKREDDFDCAKRNQLPRK